MPHKRKPNHKGYDTTRHMRNRAKDKRGKQKGAWQPEGEPGTLAGEAKRYLDSLEVRNYSPGTIASSRDKLHYFLEWATMRELEDPNAITLPILEGYQRHLHRRRKDNGNPLSATTQRTYTTAVKMLFAWMTKQNVLAANPASELELPRPEKRLHEEALTIEQMKAVLNVPDTTDPLGLRDRTMLELFYSTGIRRSELVRVEVTDINHERGTLRVYQGKGHKDRIVPVGERALSWLSRYLEESRTKLVLDSAEKALFLTSYGEAFNPDVLSRKVSKFIKEADIGRTGSCHLLRHTCATHMLDGGADIRYIQQLLGHEKLETTAIYTEVSISRLKIVHAKTHPAETSQKS